MHEVRLNITEEIFEKFMGLIDILPKDSIKIEEINTVPFYPAISFEEAGCQEEKEEKLRERLTKNLQRCDANYGDNKHQGYTALSRTNNNETYT